MDRLPRALYLNRPDRIDRKAYMEEQLTRLGFDFERVNAPVLAERGRFQSVGARGSFLSHIEILNRVAKEGREMLVLEDDVVIEDVDAMREAIDLLHAKGDDWVFLYFYGLPPAPQTMVVPVVGVLNVHGQLVNPAHAHRLSIELLKRYLWVEFNGQADLDTYVDQYLADEVQHRLPFWGTQEIIRQDFERFGSNTNWREFVDERDPQRPGRRVR